MPVRDYFQLQIKICMGIKLNAPAVQSVCEVFSCMVLSLRTGWDAHSGGVYIRNGHLVFKKSLPYQILALWHQLREAFYLSAYKMTSFITLLYLVIFWWLLFEIEKKKREQERDCASALFHSPALLQVAKQSINQNLAFTNSLSKALLLPSSTADIVEYLQVCSFMHMARGP